ncbi:DUF11 domain-containing protein [Frankia sp. R82]|uniref:DUF11 domain-containing protein n=1 Tax=Frankia sp. R82 TaxID=2950553 RepID=UPI00204361F7|nr:DUF11 domain-containing protein [Frankia sp. R82]MCM3887101.1 DUF11 domain-containing protein [Frankia sp. R82]
MSIPRLGKTRGGIVLAAALLGGPLLPVGMSALPAPALAADAPSRPDRADASPPDKGDASGPDLAIGIDDGHTDVRAGDHLTYTVKIRNIGTVDAGDLVVTQTLPVGVRLRSADRDGVLHDGTVAWHTDLPAGRNTAFVVQAEVAKPPGGQLRLASVVCATPGGAARPIVCAADSDRLPAGRAAAAPGAHSDASGGLSGWLMGLYVGLGVVLVLLAGLVVRRRWWPRPSAGTRRGSHRPSAPDLDHDEDRAEVPQ